ncbi:helix-turn-helix transcriptional regulator [Streptomyces sp. ISL-11]|uniref:helix-turn-helix domain-containing protein n=1 Tax=Streptomyces sp. ISL-11 TaxID=2819174 RepID=UPI001BE6E6D7|nr:helix-turn-helix transcriptional regulator [Streptomyces sp. ISL-11]MBT2384085.1 helix-turn-helix transcriptional regulator [Streptomyces sp. ISL-11]
MTPRTEPTARQARLGVELRRMRERAGMTSREAAELLGVSPMQMSHMEVARIGVGEERLRKLAAQYGCDDAELVDALAAMTGRRGRGWWEDYRGVLSPVLLDLAELEHHALRLRALQVVHIPGLLQTADYVRSLYRDTMPELPPQQVEAIVDFRVRRRQVLDRTNPPRLDVIVHEAALRIKVGDRKVLRDQLRFLLETADRPGATVRVVPFEQDGFTGASFSMLYAEAVVRRLDTVQFDTVHGSIFVDDEEKLAGHRGVLDRVEAAALPPSESRNLIRRIEQQL